MIVNGILVQWLLADAAGGKVAGSIPVGRIFLLLETPISIASPHGFYGRSISSVA